MPIQKRNDEAEAPREPHLALLVGHESKWIPIRPGSALWIIEDRSNPNKVIPLTLKRVRVDQIAFEMADNKGGVTEYRFDLTTAKPLTKAALDRLRKNNPGAILQK